MVNTTPDQVDISKDHDDKVGDTHIFYIGWMKKFKYLGLSVTNGPMFHLQVAQKGKAATPVLLVRNRGVIMYSVKINVYSHQPSLINTAIFLVYKSSYE
jgi:hypothetical protein